MAQLSHPYMTTGKTIALTRRTSVGKVMSLLLNMLSGLVITFLPRSKHLLISWLHGCSHHLQWFWSPQNKVCHCFHHFSICLLWSDGTGRRDLCFLNVELRKGCEAQGSKFQVSNPGLVFLVTSPYLELPPSPPRVISSEQKMLLQSRTSQES